MTIRSLSGALRTAGHTLLATLALLPLSPAQGEVQLEEDEYVVFYHHDALGSPAVTTDAYGDVLWYENVEPYGRSLGRKGASGASYDADPFEEVEEEGRSRVAYTGHVRDGASDLIYMQQRHYDPALGRFLSNDPVGFTATNPLSFNRYAYANNNPYAYIDPDGRNAVEYLGGLIVESYEGVTGRGDGTFNHDLVRGALANGYNGQGAGFLSAAGQDALEIGGAFAGGAILGKIGSKIAGFFRSNKTYEITDGVRRAKANELLGNETISANVRDAQGRLIEKKDLPIDSLRSPHKSSIELNTTEQFDRFDSIQQGVKNGDSLPAIDVTPGSRGTSISDVDFTP